tara:strand:+ start:1439 stop:1684 length:246 start_codon:yes stop_codon:yes gene_type:complete
MGRKSKLTDDIKIQIDQLNLEGLSIRKIAEQLKISKSLIGNYLKSQANLKDQPPHPQALNYGRGCPCKDCLNWRLIQATKL